jgi:DNA-binding transcriptional MerR regulator
LKSNQTADGVAIRIGELARRTGTTPKAIRLYESLGLLGRVQRSGAYRIYSQKNYRQVQMIRRAQALGFSLSELGLVLHPGQGEPDWGVLLEQLDIKREATRREIERLKQLEAQVEQIAVGIRGCLAERAHRDFAQCNPLSSTAPADESA